MKYKITQKQFEMLLANFQILTDNGLELKMSGKTAKKVMPGHNGVIKEQKQFLVNIWVGGYNTKAIIFASNGSRAVELTRKLYPTARVAGATEIKRKNC